MDRCLRCAYRSGRTCTDQSYPHQFVAHRPGLMRRPLEFRNRVEVADPRLLRANKYLPARHQFIPLAQRSKPHIVGFWLIINRGRIERRPALGTETLQTDVSAIGDLSIFCRFTGLKHERAWASDNNRSQRSAAHCLAVCAVANGRGFGISFGLERHMAAVTASINFHDHFPRIPQTAMDDGCAPTGLIVHSGSGGPLTIYDRFDPRKRT
jgi:hypothetical protein